MQKADLRALVWVFACALTACALTACGIGDQSLEEVDPNAAVERPTWTADVRPILQWHCAGCHAPDAQPGSVAGYAYHSCQAARRSYDGVEDTVFEDETMPPGGAPRLAAWEKLTLRRWAAQGMRCD